LTHPGKARDQEGKRAVLIVLDSVGVGALPDAAEYGDEGSNTLLHVAERAGGLDVPNLEKLGLGSIIELPGVHTLPRPGASFGRMAEASRGKDTVAGHWEMMGVVLDEPLALFPDGFPQEMIREFMESTGVSEVLGNKAASGTEIIEELGPEHIRTSAPIIYTSADSVFQVAAHIKTAPLDELYRMCERARVVCDGYNIGRVIARPFAGEAGSFERTADRKDYPMKPPSPTVLDLLENKGIPVTGIGKIENIFAGQGVARSLPAKNNSHGMLLLEKELSHTLNGLIFVNLIDFDMLYGHRNDAKGYAEAIETFDKELGGLLDIMNENDLLIVSADHGCDPTHPGTDHTREYAPLLVYSKKLAARALGTRKTFGDIGASVMSWLETGEELPGALSFVN